MLGKVLGKIGLSAKITNIVRGMCVCQHESEVQVRRQKHWVKSEREELGKDAHCHQPFSAYSQRS